jgi:hypothetical protein
MKIYECDGCGKQEKSRSGFRPSIWFERFQDGQEFHACSRECIEKVAAKFGGTTCILPV